MLPNLKCGGVVVNEFRVMGGRKRGSFTAGPTVRISFPPPANLFLRRAARAGDARYYIIVAGCIIFSAAQAPGSKEDPASCREFFQEIHRRGLPDPLLVVYDPRSKNAHRAPALPLSQGEQPAKQGIRRPLA